MIPNLHYDLIYIYLGVTLLITSYVKVSHM